MGFTDLVSDAGLTVLNHWLKTRSYIAGYTPSQADVKVFQTLSGEPPVEKYPYAYRWYKHIASFTTEFSSLPGDPSKEYTAYGPESADLTINPAKAPSAPAGAPAVVAAEGDDDDDVDLFGSDEEEEDPEAVKERERRLEEYKQKKAGKTKPAAKTIVTLEVKPWDDETSMKDLEAAVRAIAQDGLVWGGGKLVPVGYGVSKLQINIVIEDEKVSIDDLRAQIEEECEDFVQSTDVAAMQKL